jgi:hypothetical protein
LRAPAGHDDQDQVVELPGAAVFIQHRGELGNAAVAGDTVWVVTGCDGVARRGAAFEAAALPVGYQVLRAPTRIDRGHLAQHGQAPAIAGDAPRAGGATIGHDAP